MAIGSDEPVVVQSMTNTDTADARCHRVQVAALAHAGSELVRITVNNEAAARAVPVIRRKLDDLGVGVPLIGDFHYNGHQLLVDHPEAAAALAKYRINPGQRRLQASRRELQHHRARGCRARSPGTHRRQLGLSRPGPAHRADGRQRPFGSARDARAVMIEAMLQSALRSAELAEATGLAHDRIVISAKVSGVRRPRRRLSRARWPLRLPPPPRPHRGRHGHEGHRGLHRRPGHPARRRASATPSGYP